MNYENYNETIEKIREEEFPWSTALIFSENLLTEMTGEQKGSYWINGCSEALALALVYVIRARCYLPAEPTKGAPKIDGKGRIIRPETSEDIFREARVLLSLPEVMDDLCHTAVLKDTDDAKLLIGVYRHWSSSSNKSDLAHFAANALGKLEMKEKGE